MKKLLLIAFLVATFTVSSYAETVQVAVASNFTDPMKIIAAEFEKQSKHKISLSFGGTGSFYAQISNGAPFHILLSADSATPQKLITDKLAVESSRFTYAKGQLILWSASQSIVNADTITKGNFKHIAIADPLLAPYGEAAKATLIKINLWEQLNSERKIVMGKNIGQTLQFIESGNAEIGFVAMSQIYDYKKSGKGGWWIVPHEYYPPIVQDAILLKLGEGNSAAIELLEYMKSDFAKKVIQEYGYL